jgi:hypothetical protein
MVWNGCGRVLLSFGAYTQCSFRVLYRMLICAALNRLEWMRSSASAVRIQMAFKRHTVCGAYISQCAVSGTHIPYVGRARAPGPLLHLVHIMRTYQFVHTVCNSMCTHIKTHTITPHTNTHIYAHTRCGSGARRSSSWKRKPLNYSAACTLLT